MHAMNRRFFFDHVRRSLFGGRLKQKQVDGLSAMLDHWAACHGGEDIRWLAYILATAHHEVDRRMQPISEYGNAAYFRRMYDITGDRPHVARRLGNVEEGDGARFYGRGFVQLTGRANYADWSARLGVDLLATPDKALALGQATRILIGGMILGTFTGRCLGDYIAGDMCDYRSARRVVNGMDRAALIARYAEHYEAAIAGGIDHRVPVLSLAKNEGCGTDRA